MNECWHLCPTCKQDWFHTGGRGPQSCKFRKPCNECVLVVQQAVVYKGVTRDRSKRIKTPRWRAALYKNGKRVNLGSFDSPLEASRAYQDAVAVYKKEKKDGTHNAKVGSRMLVDGNPRLLDGQLRESGNAQDSGEVVL